MLPKPIARPCTFLFPMGFASYFIYQRIRGGMWEGLPREQQADGGCLVDEVLVQRGTEERSAH